MVTARRWEPKVSGAFGRPMGVFADTVRRPPVRAAFVQDKLALRLLLRASSRPSPAVFVDAPVLLRTFSAVGLAPEHPDDYEESRAGHPCSRRRFARVPERDLETTTEVPASARHPQV